MNHLIKTASQSHNLCKMADQGIKLARKVCDCNLGPWISSSEIRIQYLGYLWSQLMTCLFQKLQEKERKFDIFTCPTIFTESYTWSASFMQTHTWLASFIPWSILLHKSWLWLAILTKWSVIFTWWWQVVSHLYAMKVGDSFFFELFDTIPPILHAQSTLEQK